MLLLVGILNVLFAESSPCDRLRAVCPLPGRIHVVFGHVVSGQEVVSQVEAVPTDNKSRPLQDVRVARCGQLVLQTKHKGQRGRVR